MGSVPADFGGEGLVSPHSCQSTLCGSRIPVLDPSLCIGCLCHFHHIHAQFHDDNMPLHCVRWRNLPLLSLGFGPWSLATVCPVHLFLPAACHGVYLSTALSRSCEVDEDAVFWTDELIGCLAVELRPNPIVTGVELRLGFPGRDSIQSYFGHLCQAFCSGWDHARLQTLSIGDF